MSKEGNPDDSSGTSGVDKWSQASLDSAPLIIFDLSGFLDIQNEGEADALARQVMLVYASNKRARMPFRIALCGIPHRVDDPLSSQEGTPQQPGAQQVLLQRLEALNFRSWGPPGWVSWHEDDPWDVFSDRTLLYLSADADDALEDVRGGPGEEAYVIGGVVDRQTRKPGASLHRADSSGIRPVRLPTAGVIETPQKADALSCLACVQAMMAFHAGARPSWGDAFVAAPAMWCAPLRKYVVWRGDYKHLNKPENRRRFHHITG